MECSEIANTGPVETMEIQKKTKKQKRQEKNHKVEEELF